MKFDFEKHKSIEKIGQILICSHKHKRVGGSSPPPAGIGLMWILVNIYYFEDKIAILSSFGITYGPHWRKRKRVDKVDRKEHFSRLDLSWHFVHGKSGIEFI